MNGDSTQDESRGSQLELSSPARERPSTEVGDAVYIALGELKKSGKPQKALVAVSNGGENDNRYTMGEAGLHGVGGRCANYPPENAPSGKYCKIKVELLVPAGLPRLSVYARSGYYLR